MSTTMGSATSFKLGGTPWTRTDPKKAKTLTWKKTFNSLTVAWYDGLKEIVRLQHAVAQPGGVRGVS